MERLQKVLAQSNVASRRKSEQIILEGRVKVNGVVVTELGTKVSKTDEIKVDGKSIKEAKKIHLLLNKPSGYVSTTSDDKKRKTIMDLIEEEGEYKNERLYPVGRLDFDTAGVIIITNDGLLTSKLTKSDFTVEKEYFVRVQGIVIRKKLNELRKGLKLKNGKFFKPKEINLVELDKANQSTLLRFVIFEGEHNEIKEMTLLIGHEVKNITRVRYDFLTLDGVKRGGYRELTTHEVRKLHSSRK